jgi:hypothetical protein
MFSKDVRAEMPPAQNFHPEFGYFCPSPRMRRKVRGAAVTVLAGIMLIAAGTALTLMPQLGPQSPGDGVREESALSANASPPTGQPAGAADQSISATLALGAADPATSSHAQTSCDDPSGAFLAAQCQQLGRTGKSRMTRAARAARYRPATLPIGGADASLEAPPQRPGAASPLPVAETAGAAVALEAAPPSAPEKPAAPAAPAKKPVKTAHKRAPNRDFASADTLPAARSPGFDLFGLFHDPSRSGNGAFAMSR